MPLQPPHLSYLGLGLGDHKSKDVTGRVWSLSFIVTELQNTSLGSSLCEAWLLQGIKVRIMSASNWIYLDFELWAEEVGVFTGESVAVKLLHHHRCFASHESDVVEILKKLLHFSIHYKPKWDEVFSGGYNVQFYIDATETEKFNPSYKCSTCMGEQYSVEVPVIYPLWECCLPVKTEEHSSIVRSQSIP